MDFICQRLKSCPICRGWKFIQAWKKSSILIHLVFTKWNVLEFISHSCGIICIPLNIYYDIFPTVLFQILSHIFCIGQNILLCYVGIIIIVTVPPHRWTCCKTVFVHTLYFPLILNCPNALVITNTCNTHCWIPNLIIYLNNHSIITYCIGSNDNSTIIL